MRYFLVRLADTGNVLGVCREIGLSRQSVYGLRVRDAAFARAWEGAMLRHRDSLVDLCMERAVHGVIEEVVIDGALTERTRPDGAMLRHMLGRADRICADERLAARPARQSELHFEALLDCLDPPEQGNGDRTGEALPDRAALLADIEDSAHWDWEAASEREFFARTEPAPELGPGMRIGKVEPPKGYASDEEAVEALAAYKRVMATPPDKVDISDLDPAAAEAWTDEQWQRAERSGLMARMFADEGTEDGGVEQRAGDADP